MCVCVCVCVGVYLSVCLPARVPVSPRTSLFCARRRRTLIVINAQSPPSRRADPHLVGMNYGADASKFSSEIVPTTPSAFSLLLGLWLSRAMDDVIEREAEIKLFAVVCVHANLNGRLTSTCRSRRGAQLQKAASREGLPGFCPEGSGRFPSDFHKRKIFFYGCMLMLGLPFTDNAQMAASRFRIKFKADGRIRETSENCSGAERKRREKKKRKKGKV